MTNDKRTDLRSALREALIDTLQRGSPIMPTSDDSVASAMQKAVAEYIEAAHNYIDKIHYAQGADCRLLRLVEARESLMLLGFDLSAR